MYQITVDIPLILLPNNHRCLLRQRIGRGNGTTRDTGRMGGQRTEKRGVVRIGYNKLTYSTSDRPRFVAIINGGGGNESPKSRGRGFFIGGVRRRNGRCGTRIDVVGG